MTPREATLDEAVHQVMRDRFSEAFMYGRGYGVLLPKEPRGGFRLRPTKAGKWWIRATFAALTAAR